VRRVARYSATNAVASSESAREVLMSLIGVITNCLRTDFEVLDADGDVVDHRVPDEIDGQTVEGIEDGEYVVGGALVPHDDDAEIVLEPGEIEEAREWLEGREWHLKPGFEEAWAEIHAALGAKRLE